MDTVEPMRILCTGLSHKTAELSLRERVAFSNRAAEVAMERLLARWGECEFVLLSTCNRTETYIARPLHGHPRAEELVEWIASDRAVDRFELASATYTLTDAAAVRHLLAVASGLDSLVIGEPQITAQVREAYDRSSRLGAAGTTLNTLFQASLHVAKHVRSETQIAAGRISIASVAVDCVEESLGTVHGRCMLSVGAGKMNRMMLQRLKELGAGPLLIANRSEDRAGQIAAVCGGQIVPFDEMPKHVFRADVVLCSTGSPGPLLSRQCLERVMARRPDRPLLVVDVAVPRDVEPTAGEIDKVTLYNIDDLERVAARNLTDRHREIVASEAIIARHVAEVLRELKIRDVAPTIRALNRKLRRIADQELSAAANKLQVHEDAEADMKVLRRALHRTVRQILHPVTDNLRKSAGSDKARAQVAALRKLFDLDA
jgi:glutamyl-tRNA reductase